MVLVAMHTNPGIVPLCHNMTHVVTSIANTVNARFGKDGTFDRALGPLLGNGMQRFLKRCKGDRQNRLGVYA